jgi:hypothetical protein
MTIKPDLFYGRKLELAALDRAWKRHGAGGQMLLLYGRRRLGKTFLDAAGNDTESLKRLQNTVIGPRSDHGQGGLGASILTSIKPC